MPLVFSDRFLGQFAEERQGGGFVVSSLHHHENGHAEEDELDEVLELKPGDALKEVAEHHIVQEPGDEEVQTLKTVEADEAVVTEATAGQHDDGSDPADAGDIAEDGGGAGIDRGQGIGYGLGGGWSGVADGLPGPALRTIGGRADLVSALAAKWHLLLHTLFRSEERRVGK